MEELGKGKRLYFFVIYQLNGRQSCIQCGHAMGEFVLKYHKDEVIFGEFIDFLRNHKTWVVLDGGTTNNNPNNLGTINILKNQFEEHDVPFAEFYEEDLTDALTAFCFIVDECVYSLPRNISEEDYPSWREEMVKNVGEKNMFIYDMIKDKPLAKN
jgi:hypothetical protein